MDIRRRAADGWLELTIEGRLDGSWADHLDAELTEIVREGNHRLLLDLQGVRFLSSAGIAVLVKSYNQLTAIKGRLVIGSASAQVRTVLEITRLADLLMLRPDEASPETLTQGSTLVRDGLVLQVFDLAPNAHMTCRWGAVDASVGSPADAPSDPIVLRCTESLAAIGIGAFGEDARECSERFGEFVAVAGAAAYLPADGTETPDYLLGSGARPAELRVLRHLTCEGGFAQVARFETMKPRTAVSLSDLAAACLHVARVDAAGLVAIAETSGLVGAALRQSPTRTGNADFFGFPDIRARLSFTAERAFSRSLALIVGIVQRNGGPVPASEVRALDRDSGLTGHFHAAVFPYHAFKKGRLDLGETVRTLFQTESLQGVLHLLNDDREIAGVGQSEFTRGACWIGRLGAKR
jgi:anti-anti-sigma factor